MPPNNNPYYPPNPAAQQQPVQGSSLPSGRPVGLIVAVVLLTLLLLAAIGFGVWAFGERQDYKNNSDQKSAAAAEEAKIKTQEEDKIQFAEEIKNPLKVYTGPASYGSIKVSYPKTWSTYANNVNGSGTPVDVYLHPDFVPTVVTSSGAKPAIALHIRVLNQAYDQVLQSRQSYVRSGAASATPYALPKMPDQVGMKITGKLTEQLNGTEIVLPLRDKTIVITTETDQFMADFNTYIIPNLVFVP